MALVVYTSSDEQWSFAEQTTWGTAVGDAAASMGILTEGFGVDSAINFRNPPRARSQRYNHTNDIIADQKGVAFQTNGLSTPALHDVLDFLLYGVMQNVVESTLSASVHRKTFTFPETQPDFSVNAGEFFTIWGNSQVASNNQKMHDAIISELAISCSNGSNEGELFASPTFFARNHSDVANYSGTVTYPTLLATNEFMFYDIVTAKIGGNAVVLGDNGFSITIRNSASKVGQSSGVFESIVLQRYDVEISANILWDSVSRSLAANTKDGTTVTFEFEWGVAGAVGHLEFTGSAKISDAVNIEHAQEGNFVTIPLVCAGSYGVTEPLQVIMTTANDRGW